MAAFCGQFTNLLQSSDSGFEESHFDSKTTSFFFLLFCLCCGLSTLLLACIVVTRKRKWTSSETKMTYPCGRDNEKEYEVFLSFRGPDSRLTIADLLYSTLTHAGICVFMDNEELRIGKEIGGEILQAINNSKIYIPIFSKNYASSKWCLCEIARMMECKKKSSDKVILPIFCDVDADDVKLKTKLYQKALRKHSSKLGKDVKKQWEEALKEVGRIKGLNLKDHGIYELTKLVTEEVCATLWTRSEGKLDDRLVGIHKPMEDIMKLLGRGTSDVRFIVIHGIGGIGKTTLAKLVFNQISSQFQGCCIFLSDVRESSCTTHGIMSLQEKLLSKMLNLRSLLIHDTDDGVNMIQQRLKDKKVLIVLDDLDRSEQLEKLAGASSWFGKGSIIIITTRNVDYLIDNDVRPDDDDVLATIKCEDFYFHEMQVMQHDDALRLFSRHAFKSEAPPPNFDDISREVVATTGGLPLAIKIIGSSFYLKGKNAWKEKLKKLKKVVDKDVREKFMISYEDLDRYEKQIFLDIACLFIGKEKIDATYYWEARGFFPKSGINVLINKSLIKIIVGDKLWMHDLLRDLGRNIVHEENEEIPGKRSRLWLPEEAFGVVQKKKGTEKVVALKLGRVEESYNFTEEQFAGLTNLKFLELDGGNFTNGEFNGDLSELVWLSWDNCPEFQTTDLSFDSLVVLKLSGNHITETWGGWHPILAAKQLKVFNLTRCPCLVRTLSFYSFPTLKRLVFCDCHKLAEIDESIGDLKSLHDLTISNNPVNTSLGYSLEMPPQPRLLPNSIGSLTSLTMLRMYNIGLIELHPSIGEMVALKHLCLKRCLQLGNLPSSIGKLTSLLELDISYSRIKELPNSIGKLKRLNSLEASNSALRRLPNSIGRLESLNTLSLSRTRITQLPPSIGELTSLVTLLISFSRIKELPDSIGKLRQLNNLQVNNTALRHLPNSIGRLESLNKLRLSGTRITKLPPSIGKLVALKNLSLSCPNLRNLPSSIGELTSLVELDISSSRIEELPDSIGELKRLTNLLVDDSALRHLPNSIGRLESLNALSLAGTRITELPSSIEELVALTHLALVCPNLGNLPSSIGELTSLVELAIISSRIEELPDSIGKLRRLTRLLANDSALRHLPNSIGRLESLDMLSLAGTKITELPPSIGELVALTRLDLKCPDLGNLPSSIGKLTSLVNLDISFSRIEELPDSIGELKRLSRLLADDSALQRLPNSIGKLESLNELSLSGTRITELPRAIGNLKSLSSMNLFRTPMSKLPNDLSSLSQLKRFRISRFGLQHDETRHLPFLICFGLCYVKLSVEISRPLHSSLKNVYKFKLHSCWLREIQVDVLRELESLCVLAFVRCEFVERLWGLSYLKNLKELEFYNCSKLIEIQDLEEVEMLERLCIGNCSSIQRLPDLSGLQKLTDLSFFECESLTRVPDVADKRTCRIEVQRCARLGGDIEGVPHHEYVGRSGRRT